MIRHSGTGLAFKNTHKTIGNSDTRTLGGHSEGTRALKALRQLGAWALKALRHLGHLGHLGTWALGYLRLSSTWAPYLANSLEVHNAVLKPTGFCILGLLTPSG